MSYWAEGKGTLALNDYGKSHIDVLYEIISYDFNHEINGDSLHISFYGDYNEHEIIEALKDISKFVEKEQAVYFFGEAHDVWRFVFKKDGLYEENAEIVWITPGSKR